MKVIRVRGPPLVIRLSLLLAATIRSTTGLLPLLEPRMGMKPTTTERTPPPREHTFPPVNLWRRNKQEAGKKKSKRERLLKLNRPRRKENQKAEEQPITEGTFIRILAG
jgi:hypothetical protein